MNVERKKGSLSKDSSLPRVSSFMESHKQWDSQTLIIGGAGGSYKGNLRVIPVWWPVVFLFFGVTTLSNKKVAGGLLGYCQPASSQFLHITWHLNCLPRTMYRMKKAATPIFGWDALANLRLPGF